MYYEPDPGVCKKKQKLGTIESKFSEHTVTKF